MRKRAERGRERESESEKEKEKEKESGRGGEREDTKSILISEYRHISAAV